MKRNIFIVVLIFLVFFTISFLTNILGSINPNVSDSYHLSGAMTGLLPFSFFIAYAIMSIPSGMIVQRYKEKFSMTLAWLISSVGAFIFAIYPTFPVFLISLFSIGIGMAMLQVAINPLLRAAGGEKDFAFLSVLAQLLFGGASYLSPMVYSYLVTHLKEGVQPSGFAVELLSKITPPKLPWVSLYWLFGIISLVMAVILLLSKFPKVELKDDEKIDTWDIHLKLFKNKTVILFFFGIFAYVGTEQGIANWISEFLRSYHGLSPEIKGASTVGWFWGMLTIGCLLGLVLLKLIDSKIVLRIFSISAIVILIVTLLGNAQIALIGFPALGFCLSVMWSIIFSLALNSLDKFHGTFSGILCTGIAGGAIVPLIIGQLKDMIGLRFGLFFLVLTLTYILSIGIWANPLVKNETIKIKKGEA